MSSGRLWQLIGAGAVVGGGYYLYNAGGDPKAAEKRFEADASKAASKLGLAGKDKEAQKHAEVSVADAGKKADDLLTDAKQATHKVDSKLEAYRKDAEKKIDAGLKETRDSANHALDEFDKKVTEGANKAKSGLSSWFGGK